MSDRDLLHVRPRSFDVKKTNTDLLTKLEVRTSELEERRKAAGELRASQVERIDRSINLIIILK
jgi:hypothetical protein